MPPKVNAVAENVLFYKKAGRRSLPFLFDEKQKKIDKFDIIPYNVANI